MIRSVRKSSKVFFSSVAVCSLILRISFSRLSCSVIAAELSSTLAKGLSSAALVLSSASFSIPAKIAPSMPALNFAETTSNEAPMPACIILPKARMWSRNPPPNFPRTAISLKPRALIAAPSASPEIRSPTNIVALLLNFSIESAALSSDNWVSALIMPNADSMSSAILP